MDIFSRTAIMESGYKPEPEASGSLKMAEKKILIVDDDREFLEEIQATLVATGYKVTTVDDSMAAIRAARVIKPDVILLDLRMKAISGFEIADRLKGFPETSSIPLIAMTGFYTLKEHAWLMNFCGIKRCMRKPFNPLDVIAEIENVLKENINNEKKD
jgi:two-component system alkaline phosphatase synthesis response regulator PhoP